LGDIAIRLEPAEEQETLLYHYGFTCRFIYNHALDQRNLSRDQNPVRIMNKAIKFLCWIAVTVILSAQTTSAAGEETLTKPDGAKYVGKWQDGKRHGQGTMTYPDGAKYVGEWQDGKRHGQGTYTYPDGAKYVGGYKDGKRHGQGTYTWPNGTKYVGGYKDGKRHGQGTMTYPDGAKYVGEYKDNKAWNGILYDKDGNVEGTYSNGVVK
jgi:hypothetical protein